MQDFLASLSKVIKTADPNWFWVGVMLGLVFALFAFWKMFADYRRARLISNIPTAKVRSAPQGYIELSGQAVAMEGPVIRSPVSLKECVWYHYTIEERRSHYDSSGRRSSRWDVVKAETSDDLFLLRDETGDCVIDPESAEVITNYNRRWYGDDLAQRRRFKEKLILAGQPLYAIGWHQSFSESEPESFRREVTQLLRHWKQNPDLLIQDYDTDGDGQISFNEWDKVRHNASEQIKRERDKRRNTQLSMIKQSPNRYQHFILSVEPEQRLVRRYQLAAMGSLILFFSLGTALVWAFNQRMGV
jgi:hypothetical protein